MPLLEEWGIASRLASRAGFPGCFDGFVTELADEWLRNPRAARELAEVEIFACGPTPMLEATAALARRHGVPCQVSLEEFMACAVGGCAGCTVLVRTPEGPAMKRVCVDGPVFDALHGVLASAAQNAPCARSRSPVTGDPLADTDAPHGVLARQFVMRGSPRASSPGLYPKLILASRLARESALASASSSSTRPCL